MEVKHTAYTGKIGPEAFAELIERNPKADQRHLVACDAAIANRAKDGNPMSIHEFCEKAVTVFIRGMCNKTTLAALGELGEIAFGVERIFCNECPQDGECDHYLLDELPDTVESEEDLFRHLLK